MELESRELLPEQKAALEGAHAKRLLLRTLVLLSGEEHLGDFFKSIREYLLTFSSIEDHFKLRGSTIFFDGPGILSGLHVKSSVAIEAAHCDWIGDILVRIEGYYFLEKAPHRGVSSEKQLRMLDLQEEIFDLELELRQLLKSRYRIESGFTYNFVRNCIVL